MQRAVIVIMGLTFLTLFSLAGQGCAACKTCASCPKAGTVYAPKGAEITTDTLKTLIRSGIPLVILDARSGDYDDGRRIPGARNLPAEADAATVAQALPDKEALIVTYCNSLVCPASRMLAENLAKLGYRNVLEYAPGIKGWVEDGNEFVQAAGHPAGHVGH